MVRTQRSPRCCCTSSVSVIGWPCDVVVHRQRVVDRRQRARERDVDDRTDHLHDRACVHMRSLALIAAWPPAISSSSWVMLPWRSLLYSSFRSLISPSALSVALFIDTMRALCSLALAFSSTM